jgi:hypothetical protein
VLWPRSIAMPRAVLLDAAIRFVEENLRLAGVLHDP